MRIRSIKPEFWRSPDITALGIPDRLLFIGLWSYVDDDGIGLDDEATIIGDLFATDMFRNFTDTSLMVHGGLQRLETAGLIARYEVGARRYLVVTNFRSHQVINRPKPSRFPRPDGETTERTDTSVTNHAHVTAGERSREQGTGEGNLSPFCLKHPSGTDHPCGPCGTARTRYKAALEAEKTKPSPAVVAPTTCTVHAEYPLPCTRCEEGT